MAKSQWADIDLGKLATEVIGRNGKFHIMVAFMGISLMPALVMDRNGRLIYMNKLAEQHFGVKTTRVIGQPFAEILKLNERDTARMHRESKKVLAAHEAHVFLEFYEKPLRQSVLKFPFTDDDDDVLLGAFILPHQV
jgi:nitrogen-specific signal transduction histidine kinase